MYDKKDEDFHLPSVWISESGRPAAAAPMRKLWLLKLEQSRPAFCSANLMAATSCVRVRGEPSWRTKSGPGMEERLAKNDSKAVTAQTGWLV